MARGAQFMALAQIQMIAVRHSVFCIDFMPFLFVGKFFFGCVTTLQFIPTICDRIVAVQSCDPIDRMQLKQRDYGEPRWEIVLRSRSNTPVTPWPWCDWGITATFRSQCSRSAVLSALAQLVMWTSSVT